MESSQSRAYVCMSSCRVFEVKKRNYNNIKLNVIADCSLDSSVHCLFLIEDVGESVDAIRLISF